jgi:tRNA-dihydrouridine synthase B
MSSRQIQIEMAPMQGFTSEIYRRAYLKYFRGISHTYSPFITLARGSIRSRDRRELEAGQDSGAEFTPQIIAATGSEATDLVKIVIESGFERVNLNLGCPFPMVTKRRRGAGLLEHPEQLRHVLESIFNASETLHVSVKTRLGYRDSKEFQELITVFNDFPLKKIIVHPRIGTQKYGGEPNWDDFERLAPCLEAPVVANGDIETAADAQRLLSRFPFVTGLMIGRGLLRDPLLPSRIMGMDPPPNKLNTLRDFHDEIWASHIQQGLSPVHLLDRMKAFWSYFAFSFENPHKVFKKIKKCRDAGRYVEIVKQVCGST